MYLITFGVIFALEMVLRLATIGFNLNQYFWLEILIIFLISNAVAVIPFILRNLLTGRKGKISYGLLMFIIGFFYAAQIVYNSVFGTYFTAYSAVNGAGQAFEFFDVVLSNIWDEKWYILIIIAIVIPMIILVCKNKSWVERRGQNANKKLLAVACILIMLSSAVGSYIIMSIEDENPKSPYQRIHVVGEMKSSVETCGLMGAMVLDTYRAIFGFTPKLDIEENYAEVTREDNIIAGLNFMKMVSNESDETIKTMHKYFGSLEPTKKNDKTGIFEGKNLIFITAEAFSDIAIDPVYTPTLYKLQQESYQFTNYYNPIWGVSTIDGEYVNLQGLIPKPGAWAMKESSYNSLPFTLANQFKSSGYITKAFHNHSIYFYERNVSHPNLGYDFKGQDREYFFTESWPESDLEMVDQTTWEFLSPNEDGEIEPFHVYYLTVSGHLAYNFYGNNMAMKNQSLVEDMNLSESCKAYMATQIELDRSLEMLLQRLEEAGALEDTVIAIAGDHYPYGLTAAEISEFKGHKVDEEYEMYKSTFIIWTPGLKKETVDKVCGNMDILPTLINLFGFEYDSRLLMGKDIFSDSTGIVVFKDKNWITDNGTRSDLEDTAPEYVKSIDKKVSNMFTYSTLILDNDYYSYILRYLENK